MLNGIYVFEYFFLWRFVSLFISVAGLNQDLSNLAVCAVRQLSVEVHIDIMRQEVPGLAG